MTTPNFPYRYNNTYGRWENPTGQFLSNDAVNAEMRKHQEATFNVLENLTTQLYAGQLSVQQWQIGVAAELKDAHLAQAMYGAGGKANMTQANWGRVGGTLADEYRYLANFAQDISNGSVSEAQALARIVQYGNATQQSYHREYVEGTKENERIYWRLNPADHCADCVSLASGSPYAPADLPTVPGAGATQCRGNCKCELERQAA